MGVLDHVLTRVHEKVAIIIPHYTDEETGTEKSSNLLKVKQMVSRLSWDSNPESLDPEVMLLTTYTTLIWTM